MTEAAQFQTEITPDLATQIINLGIEINMIAAGTMPESDSDKITEAKKLVELAHQQMAIAQQIGEHNVVPKQLEVMKAIINLTPQIGIDDALIKFQQDTATPSIGQPPAAAVPAPPVPEPQPAPPPPPIQPPPAPAPPATPESSEPANGEIWADAEGNHWQITRYVGGPQLEARAVVSGETTVLPTGFLQHRVPAQATPSVSAAPASSPVAPIPEPEAVAPSVASDLPAPPQVTLQIGEMRVCPGDRQIYQLQSEHNGNLILVDSAGAQAMIAREQWIGWPPHTPPVISEQTTPVPEPPAVEPVVVQPPPPEPPAPPAAATVIVDDDEGDDKYAKVLEDATAVYLPQAMPAPADLEHPATPFPEDLTAVQDIEARRLHSQFNALGARARYLYGLEAAKARACERVYDAHVRGPMRESRAELGKDAALAEVRQRADEHESVEPWLRRRDLHRERADAYKTFLSIYTEHVTVLSRDWSMRAQEEQGS